MPKSNYGHKTRRVNEPAAPKPKANVRLELKTGEDVYELWQARIKKSLRWRLNHFNGDNVWKKAYRMFRGDHWRNGVGWDDADSELPRDRITVNLTGATILDYMPFLVRKNRKFLVKARRPEFLVSAAIQKAVINYEWKRRKMAKQAKRSVLDASIIGHGILKTGYVLEINEETSKNPQRDGKITYEDYIQKQHPYVKRVPPLLFIFDPEAPEHDLASSRWCAEIFFKPPADVLANKQYDKKVLDTVREGLISPDTVQSYMAEARDTGTAFVKPDPDFNPDNNRWVLFEVWDKKHMKYYVFLSGVEEPLVEREWPYPYLTGFPYHMIPFIEIPDEHYPYGLPKFVEDQQFELNRVRTSMFEHRRRFNRKYQVIENQVDEPELTKLETGEDGTVVIVKSPNAISPIQEANMSTDTLQIEAVIKQDFRELTGSDELVRGGALPSRTTATEVKARGNLAGLKLDERTQLVDNAIEEVASQLLEHIKHNMEVDEVVEITGPQNQTLWVRYNKDDIRGDVDIDLETVSDEDPATEKSQAIQLLQIIIQNFAIIVQSKVQINMQELFRYVFETLEIPEVARIIPITSVPPTPVPAEGQGGPGNEVGTAVPAAQVMPGQLAGAPGQISAAQFGATLGGGAQTGV